jgi:bacillithiol system protein YtxJ
MITTTTMAPLADASEIDRALADSSKRPVLIFKDSPTCGISSQVYEKNREFAYGKASRWHVPCECVKGQVRFERARGAHSHATSRRKCC